MKIFATESDGDSSHPVETVKSTGRTKSGEMIQQARTHVVQAWAPDFRFQRSCERLTMESHAYPSHAVDTENEGSLHCAAP